jgi:DNA-binding transcriptional MerR regulator
MSMTIGEAASRSGCTAPTIRFYESIGLLEAIDRTDKGRRLYARSDLERLVFIRRCRDFGLPIEQVRQLLAASAAPLETCGEAHGIVAEQIKTIRARRAELRMLETSLQTILSRCEAGCGLDGAMACTIFEDVGQVA